MITVSHREGPDPYGVDPLAADELRAGFNNKPTIEHTIPRRPWSDRSREGAVGSEETIMLDSNLPSVPRRDPWNKGRLIGQKRPLKPNQRCLKFPTKLSERAYRSGSRGWRWSVQCHGPNR